MRAMGVIEPRIACFHRVERAVEGCCFNAHFADKIFGEMDRKGGRVCRLRIGIDVVVDEL